MTHAHRILAVAAILLAACGAVRAAPGELQQFAFGAFHRCALTSGGAVQCQGPSNNFGQIGNGSTGEGPTFRPVQVIARGATKLAVGDFFNCALVDGALDCWGDIPVPGGRASRPVRVIASGVTDVAAGQRHACAIAGGAVQCWGANFTGQSRHGETSADQATPWTVIGSGASAIAAGDEQSCAVVGGAVWCWGRTGLEPDPKSVSSAASKPPVRVIASGASAIAAGTRHTCAIAGGALWCWGDNSHGQVGVGVSVEHARRSAAMPPRNTAAWFVDGEQRCFSNSVEVSCTVDHPVKVIASGVTAVSARNGATCAIVRAALQCWGANSQGGLGIASAGADVLAPTEAIAAGVSYVALGDPGACALVGGAMRCARQGVFDNTDQVFGLSDLEARAGVWRGTVGGNQVMACLNRADADSTYYYLSHLSGIALVDAGEPGAVLRESVAGKAGAAWKLQRPVGDRLDGDWSDAAGKRRLPIRLTRVTSATDPDPDCAIDGPQKVAFNAPRVAAQKPAVSQMAGRYRQVSMLKGALSMVELASEMRGATAVNANMRAWLRDQVAEYYWCALQENGGDFHKARVIAFHSRALLVVQESYETYCGGAHPSGGIAGYQTWDLASGKQVEPWSWIRGSKGDPDSPMLQRLNALIFAHAPRDYGDDECRVALKENRSYRLHPAQGGLVFSTDFAHAIRACNVDIEVPYGQLLPFLNSSGKAALAR